MTRLLRETTQQQLFTKDDGNSFQRTSQMLPTLLRYGGFDCILPIVQNGMVHQF